MFSELAAECPALLEQGMVPIHHWDDPAVIPTSPASLCWLLSPLPASGKHHGESSPAKGLPSIQTLLSLLTQPIQTQRFCLLRVLGEKSEGWWFMDCSGVHPWTVIPA